MLNTKRCMKKTFSYSAITWMWHIITMALTLAIVAFILLKCYERTTIHLVTSLNNEFSLYIDNISSQVQSNIKQLGMQTFYSPATTKLRTSDELTNFEFIEGIREMNACVTSSDLIHSIYVYNSKQQYVYTTKETGSSPLGTFSDIEATKFFREQAQDYRLKPIERYIDRPDGQQGERVYSFLLYETLDGTHFDNALMINVDFDDYNSNFFLYDYDYGKPGVLGELLLFNSNHQLVATSSAYSEEFSNMDLEVLTPVIGKEQTDGYLINTARGSKTIYMYSYMPNSQCYIARVMDYDHLMEGLTAVQNQFFFIVAVIAFAGAILAFVTMQRFYRPLQRAINSLTLRNDGDLLNGGDAMLNLDVLLENRHHEKQEYISLLKQEYIKQILTSQSGELENMAENFKHYGLELPLHRPVRLIICNKIPVIATIEKIKENYQSIFIEGASFAKHTFFVVSEESDVNINELCETLLAYEATYCGYSLSVTKMSELRKSYNNLCEVSRLSIFHPPSSLLSEAMLRNRFKENIYLDKAESRLLNALKNSRPEAVVQAYSEFIKITKHYRYNVIMFNFKRLYLVVRSMFMQNVDFDDDCTFVDIEYMEELFSSVEDFNEIHRLFYSIFDQIVENISQNEIKKNRLIIEKAKQIVVEQYTDFNLTPTSVADQLGVTQSFLAKTFRATEDISINDYINGVRIKRSRELLRDERNLTIKEITAMTGIENTQYFYTLFKKSTGLTPSLYRQLKSFDLEEQQKKDLQNQ